MCVKSCHSSAQSPPGSSHLGSKPKPSQEATSPPWSVLSLPLCRHLLLSHPHLPLRAFCGSRTPRHTPALGSWHCHPLCLEPIFLRHLSALFVPPPSCLCSNAILLTRPPWPLCFYFLFLFFTLIFIYLCVYVWLHWVFVATCGVFHCRFAGSSLGSPGF